MFKQLVNSEMTQRNLQERLATIGHTLGDLGASTKQLEAAEHNLLGEIDGLKETLADHQVPAGNPVLEMELSSKFAENTQLQLQLQEISSELKSLREQLDWKKSENEDLQQSLTEAAAKQQAAENQVFHIQSEKSALHEEIKTAEQRVREELTKAGIISRNQIKTKYEQQIQKVEGEKASLERESEKLVAQLASVQQSLVSSFSIPFSKRISIPFSKSSSLPFSILCTLLSGSR